MGDRGGDVPRRAFVGLARDALRVTSQGLVRVERDGLLIPVLVMQADTRDRPDVAAWLKRGMLGIPDPARVGWAAFSDTEPPLAILEVEVDAADEAGSFRFAIILSARGGEARGYLETIARSELLGLTDQPLMYADDTRRLLSPAVYIPIERQPVLDFLAAIR